LNVGLVPIDFSCPETHVLNKWCHNNGFTSIQLFKGGAICYVSNQTTNLFGKLLDNHQMKQ